MLGLLHPLLLSDVVLFVFSSYRISHLEEEDDEAFLVSSCAHYCWANKCNCSDFLTSRSFPRLFPLCSQVVQVCCQKSLTNETWIERKQDSTHSAARMRGAFQHKKG